MKNKWTVFVCFFAVMSIVGAAQAAPWITMSGDSLATKGGFPWNMPETNFNFKIATHDTAAAKYTNAEGTGIGMLGLTYSNFEQWGDVTISGSIPANTLNLDTYSYMEIGLVTKAMIDVAESWYLSGLFNDSAFMLVSTDSSGQYKACAGDYNLGGGRWSTAINFDETQDMLYELNLNFASDIASLQINNGAGWSSPVTVSFGTSDWTADNPDSYGYLSPEDFTEAALFVNLYNEGDANVNSVTFGDVTVTPEPGSLVLLITACLGAVVYVWRRRRG